MVTNEIVTSFLQCQYKAYLQSNHQIGQKTLYEQVARELLEAHRIKFFEQLHRKLQPSQILQDIFASKDGISAVHYILTPCFQSSSSVICFDALELSPSEETSESVIQCPIDILARERITKREKLVFATKCLLASSEKNHPFECGYMLYGQHLTRTKITLAPYWEESHHIAQQLRQMLENHEPPRFYRTS